MYPELPAAKPHFWLIVDPNEVDLCSVDPGHDVDLYVNCDLRTMTAIWMGLATVADQTEAGRMQLTGDDTLARSMQAWVGLSPFAAERKRVAA